MPSVGESPHTGDAIMLSMTRLLIVLVVMANAGYSYVSWDGYLFTISDGTARLKKDGEVLFVCQRSEVKIIHHHLIVESYGGQEVDIEISPATESAIVNEFRRDADRQRLHEPDFHRPVPVVAVPVVRPEDEPPTVTAVGGSKAPQR